MLKTPPPEVLEKMQKILDKYAKPKKSSAIEQEVLEAERKLGGPVWLKVAAAKWKEKKEQKCPQNSPN